MVLRKSSGYEGQPTMMIQNNSFLFLLAGGRAKGRLSCFVMEAKLANLANLLMNPILWVNLLYFISMCCINSHQQAWLSWGG